VAAEDELLTFFLAVTKAVDAIRSASIAFVLRPVSFTFFA
jgi:hypothetical protein